jgi:allophanate hydrolase subunit 2
VLRAGEYDLFPAAAQESFWATNWKITHQSDRGGYRLAGQKLALDTPVEMRSYGLVAGIVQVPPSGQPIIQLSDANTAGGYPKIATVIEADLWRLGQARHGSFIRFIEVTYEEAVEAMTPVTAYLKQIRRGTNLYRSL